MKTGSWTTYAVCGHAEVVVARLPTRPVIYVDMGEHGTAKSASTRCHNMRIFHCVTTMRGGCFGGSESERRRVPVPRVRELDWPIARYRVHGG